MEYTLDQVLKKIGKVKSALPHLLIIIEMYEASGPTIWHMRLDGGLDLIKDFNTLDKFMEYDPSADPNI